MHRFAYLLAAAVVAAPALADELPLCPAIPAPQLVVERDADLAARQATFAELAARAAGPDGTAHDRQVVGTHYRLGRDHPAPLVDRDLERARKLLAHAALGGSLQAMLGMAELERAAGEPMKAMVWAQAFAHFSRQAGGIVEAEEYVADLMVRLYDELGRGEAVENDIREFTNGFVQAATPKIEAAIAARNGPFTPACRVEGDPPPPYAAMLRDDDRKVAAARTRAQRGLAEPGFAYFYVRIDAAGNVVDADAFESLPDGRAARGLEGTARRLRFEAVAPGTPVRTMIVPLAYGVGSARLRD